MSGSASGGSAYKKTRPRRASAVSAALAVAFTRELNRGGFVSGHEFSRAVSVRNKEGFSRRCVAMEFCVAYAFVKDGSSQALGTSAL
jgi:hypothetical protein